MNNKPLGWVDAVWRQHSSTIYKLCEKKCMAVEDAKDLFQEVALKFCQHAPTLENREYVLPWLITVLSHSFCDMVTGRHSTYPISCLKEPVQDFSAISEEKSIFFRRANVMPFNYETLLEKLNSLERMIVEMSYIGGFSIKELSSIIGLSENAIRKRRRIAVLKLKKKLDALG